ncbi:1-phosphatidylinositol phosphodiesterase precursor [Paenibacillus larvae subsp. larvae]|uniref:1-phosphatidylinositol phosphodiesterase n=6 Tax=Paenibacillus larvae TaxID=1464 RepID=A0A2L1TVS7_9BACL|nr:hypothetical protein B5S25_13400 [Paenibacillus larvae subsp. pulvifaciens]AVF24765.1 1-phosphatidylinositol phosphodiesterase precursor [Paenibacillus larvae subsp. larvae]AVF29525.1 1-phosphatidylinositol phosphodiesterase precursor [Paenibacillus larvae subsp. larvae]
MFILLALNFSVQLSVAHPDWMASIKDTAKLSELSIPGTHDTMSIGYGGDIAQTQSMNLKTQLNSGVRFIDIRCRYIDGVFAIHHGPVFLHVMFGDVLNTVTEFLKNHPGETVLMRVKQEHSDVSNETFNNKLKEYMDRYPGCFFDSQNRTNTNPTLKEMRGKIVILLNVGGSTIGLNYPHNFNIQDDYHLNTNWDLYDKWLKVKTHLNKANTEHQNGSKTTFINYLSGSGGSFPYFVASGHSSPGTWAPRLATGLTTPGWSHSYPDFPRVACFLGICTIAFEGTNILTTDYITKNDLKYTGIVVSDFPGPDLINNVIGVNSHLEFLGDMYQIATALNDKSVVDMSLQTYGNVHLWEYHGGLNQKWRVIYDATKDAYQIKSVYDKDRVLAWNDYQGSRQVFATPNQHKEEHYWVLEATRDGYYIIKNKKDPTLVLDVADFKTENGSKIIVYKQNNGKNQKFKLRKV